MNGELMAESGMRGALATIVMAAMLAVGGILILASPASAAPGDLDTTFDVDGKQTTDFDSGDDVANDVAIQSNGKIVAVGESQPSGDFKDFAVSRYNADGTLDTTFGGGDGIVTTNFRQQSNQPEGANDRARAVAIQPDGKIVAAGVSDNGLSDIAVARYDADGTLDTNFGTDGLAIVEPANTSNANDVAIDASGKIVLAGVVNTGTQNPNFSLVRLESDGDLDTNFGTDGAVETDFAGSDDVGLGLALLSGGGIVVVGEAADPNATGDDFGIAKYTSSGNLDMTFGGGDGKVTTDIEGGEDEANAVAVAGNGDLIVGGLAGNDVECNPDCVSDDFSDFGLARYTADGSLDASFGSGGKATTDFNGGNDDARDVKIQDDGKIVAAGLADNAVDCDPGCPSESDFNDFGIARYDANGSLDAGFGADGKVQTSFFEPPALGQGFDTSSAGDEANGIAIQSDGKIVAVGETGQFQTGPGDAFEGELDFALARYGEGSTSQPNPKACTKVGTKRGDILEGTPGRDVICGRGGGDIIKGLGGNDILRGGSGDDIIRGGAGDDKLFGQRGNDVLRGGPGKDRLVGGRGNDSVRQ